MIAIDLPIFFDAVRPLFSGGLNPSQVEGMEHILTTWMRGVEAGANDDPRWLSYALASAFHETGQTMQPIEEWGRGEGHDYGETDPETGQAYFGRGLIQLTHRENYRRATQELELTGEQDLEWHADQALDPEISVLVMFSGMTGGWFTGKSLGDYFSDTKNDPVNARQIVNGNDDDELIASFHEIFLTAVQVSVIEIAEPGPEVAAVPYVIVTLHSDVPVTIAVSVGRNVTLLGAVPVPASEE